MDQNILNDIFPYDSFLNRIEYNRLFPGKKKMELI